MTRYAKGTHVSSDRSRAEIERTLMRYKAEKFAYFTDRGSAAIAFVVNGRAIRMRLPLPDPDKFMTTAKGKRRSIEAARREWEAACRQSWRALALVVKAKLEASHSGITTFEDEWLAYFVRDDGKTIGEVLRPQLDAVRGGGALLLGMEQPR